VTGRKIFVCYRREDSAGHAGRLYDRLNLRFPGRVFMDVAGIGLGTRWAEVIEATLASCEVVLLLIGRRWLDRDADGRRRIDDPDDPLRAEMRTALKLQRKIVPVLVGGAALPERDALPADVAAAIDWQALRVDDDDFDHDAQRLTRALEAHLDEAPDEPHLDEQAARQAQIDTLFEESQRAVQQGAWVTAAQTLRSVLSLDPGNARAAAELRSVEAQWAEAWRRGQQASTVVSGRRPWAAVGIVGVIVVVFGIAASLLAVLVVLADLGSGGEPEPPDVSTFVHDPPPGDGNPGDDDPGDVGPVDPGSSGSGIPDRTGGTSLASRLVGQWTIASYALQNVRLPIVGQVTLADGGGGRLFFLTQVTNQTNGMSFYYRGVLQQQGGVWTTLTTESNDPGASGFPVATRIALNGNELTISNDHGEFAVLHRH